jgi:hypothetical protein
MELMVDLGTGLCVYVIPGDEPCELVLWPNQIKCASRTRPPIDSRLPGQWNFLTCGNACAFLSSVQLVNMITHSISYFTTAFYLGRMLELSKSRFGHASNTPFLLVVSSMLTECRSHCARTDLMTWMTQIDLVEQCWASHGHGETSVSLPIDISATGSLVQPALSTALAEMPRQHGAGS